MAQSLVHDVLLEQPQPGPVDALRVLSCFIVGFIALDHYRGRRKKRRGTDGLIRANGEKKINDGGQHEEQ